LASPRSWGEIVGDFGSYSLLSAVSGRIEAKSPLRIGAGKALSIVSSDLPVVKSSKGIPVIPGSSLKGFFRGQMQKIFMVASENIEKMLKEIFGGSEENDSASAILFHELQMINGKLAERKHIAINPETGGVRNFNFFEVECVLDGAVFAGKILSARNLNPKVLALIKPVIEIANLGLGRLGGFKSRGYGEVAIRIDEISLIFPGKDLKDLNKGFEVENLIPQNFGTISVRGSASEIIIDGIKTRAEVLENSSFFGVEAKIKGEDVNGFLNSMLKQVRL